MPRFFFPPLALGLVIFGQAAVADPCTDEIARIFSGGAMDPFARPPHRQKVTAYDETGMATGENLNIIETPLRTVAGVAGQQFTMAVDRELWNAPTPEGPWTPLGYPMPEGREEALRAMLEQQAANLIDTACHGPGEDGRLHYTFRTVTDEDANGMFQGALYDIWVDPAEGRVDKMEMTDFVNSWSEGVSRARQVISFEYDPSIAVTPPAE